MQNAQYDDTKALPSAPQAARKGGDMGVGDVRAATTKGANGLTVWHASHGADGERDNPGVETENQQQAKATVGGGS